MVTRLQETWEIQNKVTYNYTPYYSYFFKVDKIFSWSFNIKLLKMNRMNI